LTDRIITLPVLVWFALMDARHQGLLRDAMRDRRCFFVRFKGRSPILVDAYLHKQHNARPAPAPMQPVQSRRIFSGGRNPYYRHFNVASAYTDTRVGVFVRRDMNCDAAKCFTIISAFTSLTLRYKGKFR